MGGGAFVHPQSTAARPRQSMSIAPMDPGGSRRASRASRARDRAESSLNDNIPLAMPVRTSRSGHRTPRRKRRSQTVPARLPRLQESRESTRAGQLLTQDRRNQVTDLLSSLREGYTGPRNTEADDQQPRSPPTDGQDDDRPARPQRTYESPLDFMRRSRATNQVIQEAQNFIGGYPDIACLIGQLPDASEAPPASEPRTRRKAKTMYL